MHGMRRQHDAAVKARVALEAIKGEKIIAQSAGENAIHPNQIRLWRKQLLNMLSELFTDRRKPRDKDRDDMEAELFRQIGQLKVELDWFK